jgi:hypothetical protein
MRTPGRTDTACPGEATEPVGLACAGAARGGVAGTDGAGGRGALEFAVLGGLAATGLAGWLGAACSAGLGAAGRGGSRASSRERLLSADKARYRE